MNAIAFLDKYSSISPENVAVITQAGSTNFYALNLLTWKAMQVLHDSGVKEGDVLAMNFDDEYKELIAILATGRLGCTVLSVSSRWPKAVSDHITAFCDARHYVTDNPSKNKTNLLTLLLTDELLQTASPRNPNIFIVKQPTAPFLIVAGSGSTGNRKLFAISHSVFHDRMLKRQTAFNITPDDRFARLSSISYIGSKLRYLTCLNAGASIALLGTDDNSVISKCRGYSITFLSAVVVQLERILSTEVQTEEHNLQFLRVLELSASTVTDSLRKRASERLCSNIYVTYSSNEFGASNIATPQQILHPGSVGKALPGVDLEIVDRAGNAVTKGQAGHIRLRTMLMIDGYIGDETATKNAFRDGWFYPGDIGHITADGQLVHLGRSDNMMILNGINIFPSEIENVLASHPDIADVVAFPLKHSVHQDIPVCLASPKPGRTLREGSLLHYARDHLGSCSPLRIFTCERFPRDEHGKVHAKDVYAIVSRIALEIPRQLEKRLVINFSLPMRPNFQQFDEWLDRLLFNDIDTKPRIQKHLPSYVANWLWRCLLLSRGLMQAAKLPVFDKPRIVSCEESDDSTNNSWRAQIILASIDVYPDRYYGLVISEAFQLAQWMCLNEPSESNIERCFETIVERVIDPIIGSLGKGKSTFQILKKAHSMGIPFRHLGRGIFQLGWGSKSVYLDRSTTERDSAIGAGFSSDKVSTARLLRSAGLPSANHQQVRDLSHAREVAQTIGWPVVVKPADGERGEGVTVAVRSDKELVRAFEVAAAASKHKRVIVEQQVDGVCHRLFVAHGKILYGVKRLPMSVTGNGRSTVEELVNEELSCQRTLPPWQRTEIQPLDELAITSLSSSGFAPTSVPGAGDLAPLRPIETTSWGGIDEEVTYRIHPDNVRIALQAAALFQLQVAGIDIISGDIGKPWYANGAIINEINFAPLLGGGDISRGYIPEFLHRLLGGDGRIPVVVYVGGKAAWLKAREHQLSLEESGIHALLTDHLTTISPNGRQVFFAIKGVYQRTKALTLSRDVDYILVVVSTDELLFTGLPLEWVERVEIVDLELQSSEEQRDYYNASKLTKEVLSLLNKWVRPTTDH